VLIPIFTGGSVVQVVFINQGEPDVDVKKINSHYCGEPDGLRARWYWAMSAASKMAWSCALVIAGTNE
jgi:hypothetical protein